MMAGEMYSLFAGTADAAFVVSPDGEICFWNSAAERLFGYRAAEVVNKTCQEILQGKGTLGTEVCMQGCSVQQCAQCNRTIPNFDLQVKTRSGELRWVNVSTIVFNDPRTHHSLIVHLAHDISARKEIENAFSSLVQVSRHVINIGEGTVGAAPIGDLSEREKHILKAFAEGKGSREVAHDLGITLATVRNHLHAINGKLRTHGRLEAVMHAKRRGLIE